ncbi:ankyrin repeat domain-containing protein [Aggregatimonas sangjinii]|uniref:Ankyrin repeat domain-containing protein n=1 Tax=Aggregatimonas sangjinii TaxID=2583587 RepID=A0A5B7SM29_9FLAO|nr:ankyrin repeat domain-containing protein [Aggregatimonas sangjinii]QCW99131.1 ankyrin repeat domain-containing protein [Aggregatimonas sangjinii]
MKKAVLTCAIASLVMVTGAFAANDTASTPVVEITSPMDYELNSFCKAIIEGDIDTVKRLIALGEDVNQKSLGKTPAIYAARHNRAEILQLLVDKGADLKIRCFRGWTIKKYAKLSNAKEALAIIEANS